MPLPETSDKNFGKVLAIKQAVSQGILTASVRVRQDQLRPQQSDHMAEVLRRVKARKAGLPDEVERVVDHGEQEAAGDEADEACEERCGEADADAADLLAGFL